MMDRDLIVEAIHLMRTSALSKSEDAVAFFRLEKALPRVDIGTMMFRNNGLKTSEEIADEALRLEAERANDPAPPFITHDDLVNNIAYLQQQARDLGSQCLDVLIPLDLEYPNAGIPEMVWKTHNDVPAEDVVAEIYRRQATAAGKPKQP